jgi:uncharacterized membrane-anchored protein
LTAQNIASRYISFLIKNRKKYLDFNKQLLIAELAGFFMGALVSVISSIFISDNFLIALYSSIADYAGSVMGFLMLFYYDNKYRYRNLSRNLRIKKILWLALSLWPSIVLADIAFILSRPYFQYILLFNNFEPVIAAIIAHFWAFGVFSIVAIISRSVLDFNKLKKIN